MPFWTFAYSNIVPTNRTRESFQKGIAGFTFAFKHLGIISKSDNNSQHISRSSVMFNTFCLLLIICDILSNHMLWIIFWARWWWANVYKDQEGDPRWFDAWVQQCQWGAAPLHSFGGSWKCQRSHWARGDHPPPSTPCFTYPAIAWPAPPWGHSSRGQGSRNDGRSPLQADGPAPSSNVHQQTLIPASASFLGV